jgi:hypothetical protein
MKTSHLFPASLLLVTILAGPISSFPGSEPTIESRTLDEQYAVAQNETGELVVLWGGDGEWFTSYMKNLFLLVLILQSLGPGDAHYCCLGSTVSSHQAQPNRGCLEIS